MSAGAAPNNSSSSASFLIKRVETGIWVHSSVARAADCRSAGPWFKSGCALFLMTAVRMRVYLRYGLALVNSFSFFSLLRRLLKKRCAPLASSLCFSPSYYLSSPSFFSPLLLAPIAQLAVSELWRSRGTATHYNGVNVIRAGFGVDGARRISTAMRLRQISASARLWRINAALLRV